MVADYTYDAFGNQTEEAEDVNPFRYAGEYWDSESGLIYLRARYYDSGVGAFTSEDPARDGLNWYVYANNNAINFFDPFGLSSTRFVSSQGAVNMRTGAGTSNAVITSLARGTEVTFTGNKTSIMIDGHYWAEVTYNGTTGWVAATYLAYERPGTREAWAAVGTHPVMSIGNHAAIIIFADPNSQLVKDNSSFFSNVWTDENGVVWRFGTMGVGERNLGATGDLVAESNRSGDVSIVTSGGNMIQLGVGYTNILSLIKYHNYFVNSSHNGTVSYMATVMWGYNSNSYAKGLLSVSGIRAPSLDGWFPGWDKPIPANMFY